MPNRMPISGMLGFIETGDVLGRVNRINGKLSFSVLNSYKFNHKVPNTYLSEIDRTSFPDCIDDFKLYHVFLDFRGLIERD